MPLLMSRLSTLVPAWLTLILPPSLTPTKGVSSIFWVLNPCASAHDAPKPIIKTSANIFRMSILFSSMWDGLAPQGTRLPFSTSAGHCHKKSTARPVGAELVKLTKCSKLDGLCGLEVAPRTAALLRQGTNGSPPKGTILELFWVNSWQVCRNL